MAKRYYLSPIIGSGSDSDPYRAKVADYGVNYVALIPSQPTGNPKQAWALAIVGTANHTALLNDNALAAMPDLLPNALMSSMSGKVRNDFNAALSKFGLNVAWAGTDAWRDVLTRIGQLAEPVFTPDAFDVVE